MQVGLSYLYFWRFIHLPLNRTYVPSSTMPFSQPKQLCSRRTAADSFGNSNGGFRSASDTR
jgi:hypothetical protein